VITRFIGDVHGQPEKYLEALKGSDYSVQVGDMGFSDTYKKIAAVDFRSHRFLEGNHDDYDHRSSLALGDWGVYNIPGFSEIFYVRGAWSIDVKPRKRMEEMGGPKSWFPQEELTYDVLQAAINKYIRLKPDVVVTHTCPQSVALEVGDPEFCIQMGYPAHPQTRTSIALQVMFEAHQPQYWIFGHFHKSWREVRNSTQFICLKELEVFDFQKRILPAKVKRV